MLEQIRALDVVHWLQAELGWTEDQAMVPIAKAMGEEKRRKEKENNAELREEGLQNLPGWGHGHGHRWQCWGVTEESYKFNLN